MPSSAPFDSPERDQTPTISLPMPGTLAAPGVSNPAASAFLDQPLPVDDLSATLAARSRGRRPSALTTGLLSALLLVIGFIGGSLVERQAVGTGGGGRAGRLVAAAGSPTAGAARSASGAGVGAGFGGGGRAGALAGGTIGTVQTITNGTLYVQTAQGTLVPVHTSSQTVVRVTQQEPVGQIAPGTTVVVRGPHANGAITARSITVAGTTGSTGAGTPSG